MKYKYVSKNKVK